MSNKKKSNLDVKGRHFFLTIPHFDKLEEVYSKLEESKEEKKIDKFAVVLETHTNDVNKAKHLHVFVSFTDRREICLTFFDFLGKHGGMERVRSIEGVLQYMNKENICKANFDVWRPLLESPKTFANTVRRMMISGMQEAELIRKYGAEIANRPWQSAIRLGHKAVSAERAKASRPYLRLRAITPALIEKRLTAEELELFKSKREFTLFVDYVNKILRYGNQQLHKQCCLSIVGAPSIGKTTVVNELKKFFNTYVFPLDGWHSQYEDGIYEIILWNEWNIKLISQSDLLLFTEGEIVDLKVKYTKAVKTDRPMIILTSNYTYQQQVLKKVYDRLERNTFTEALSVRYVELNFDKTNIWFLTKLFVDVNEDI